MCRDRQLDPIIRRFLCDRLIELAAAQSDDGRASLIGFLHLVDEAQKVKLRFRIHPTGRARLVMEALPPSIED